MVLFNVVCYLNAQSTFNGKITYKVIEKPTTDFYESMEFLGRELPYDRYLESTYTYLVSNDTLTLEIYDKFDSLYYVAIQIAEEVYFDSPPFDGNYKNVSSFKTSLELVDNWYKCRRCEDDHSAKNSISYKGQPKDSKNTSFIIRVDNSIVYSDQLLHRSLFMDVFNEHGVLTFCERSYKDDLTTKKLVENGISMEPVNMRLKLINLNW